MLRTPLNLNYMKRTIRPLYANTQATPKGCFLDPAWDYSVDIYPGMVMRRVPGAGTGVPNSPAGNVVSLCNGTDVSYGLSDFFEAPKLGIRQITDSGINACAVWVMDADAEFQVMAPAFDTALTYADSDLLYGTATGAKRGQLTNVATGNGLPVARLLSVNNINVIGGTPGQTVLGSITIGGLQARTA